MRELSLQQMSLIGGGFTLSVMAAVVGAASSVLGYAARTALLGTYSYEKAVGVGLSGWTLPVAVDAFAAYRGDMSEERVGLAAIIGVIWGMLASPSNSNVSRSD
ncbi:hypothetical protein [Bordetella sp. 15P40C-2]|uniref:hypothetical protein n=1 Tax=Bordetella sp. 15P40C-2 TaxID=2572246 RepID=UPI001323198D|nr:hypothetical protein [Bordetella sp. 15P40C-2]MVW70535.1 hypothetical protein [Bordetella sp. 15P40C-2]